ncbi:YdcH family protein [Parendozoicomonas sp. Alg238-R29]|uniref:YdcH family protein n=1 Tax=Parendozoicomonas sp. Alg238-R29 TaxID=2993446 RepID=UPI00248EF81B|nr:YdcH family protein [Parendozoicomonas sp. Alg238-R29]
MIPEKHDLADEFPDLSARLNSLDKTSPEFHSAYNRYEAIDQEIIHYETEAGCSDEHLENLKKHRLKLKDQLYYQLTHP